MKRLENDIELLEKSTIVSDNEDIYVQIVHGDDDNDESIDLSEAN